MGWCTCTIPGRRWYDRGKVDNRHLEKQVLIQLGSAALSLEQRVVHHWFACLRVLSTIKHHMEVGAGDGVIKFGCTIPEPFYVVYIICVLGCECRPNSRGQ